MQNLLDDQISKFLELLPTAAMAVNLDGEVIAWNQAIEALTGTQAKDMLGKDDQEYSILFFGEKTPMLVDLLLEPETDRLQHYPSIEIYDDGLIAEIHLPEFTPEGKTLWMKAQPIHDSTGAIIGAFQIFKDPAQVSSGNIDEMGYENFLALTENSTEVITKLDENGKILYQSPSIFRVLGYKPSDLVGGIIIELVHSEQKENLSNAIRSTIDNPEIKTNIEFQFRHNNGSWRELEAVLGHVVDKNNIPSVTMTFRDITAQRQLEEQLKVNLERRGKHVQISTQIAQVIAAAEDMADLYHRVVDTIQEKLDFYYVQLLRYNPNSNDLVVVAGSGEGGPKMLGTGYDVSLTSGAIGKAASNGESVLLQNVTDSPYWKPNPYLPETRSEIAVPIKLGSKILGVLDVHGFQEHQIDQDIQLILEVMSGQIAVTIESIRVRVEMEERLRELNTLQTISSTEGWTSFFENRDDTTRGYQYDLTSGRITETSPHRLKTSQSGMTREISQSMSVRGEIIGSIGVQEDPDRPLEQEEQELLESISIQVAEALERARLFEESQRSASELKILNDMGSAFTESLDETTIIENIYTYASQLIDIESESFSVGLLDQENNTVIHPLVVVDGERLDETHPDWDSWNSTAADEGVTGYILKERQSLLIKENFLQTLQEKGITPTPQGGLPASWLGVPVALGDRVIGVITAQSEKIANHFNERHLGLLNAVASQAAIAIENARLFHFEQERAKQERRVRTITERVRQGADIQSILRITMDELSQILGAEKSAVRLGTRDQLLNLESSDDYEPPENEETTEDES